MSASPSRWPLRARCAWPSTSPPWVVQPNASCLRLASRRVRRADLPISRAGTSHREPRRRQPTLTDRACARRGAPESRQSTVALHERDRIRVMSDGFHSSGSRSPVSTKPSFLYSAAAGVDDSQSVTASRKPSAPESCAHPATASSNSCPKPPRRALGSTHMPHSLAALRPSSTRRPPAVPRLRSSSMATNTTPFSPSSLSATRSSQNSGPSTASRSNDDENAHGASAKARSRTSRSRQPSPLRSRRISTPRA